MEDLSVTYKLFYYAKTITHINKPLYNYFKGNINSYTSSYINTQAQIGMIRIAEQIQFFFKTKKTILE